MRSSKKSWSLQTGTRASYADTANVVSKLVQENSDLFSTVDEAIAFNDAATMLFKTAGKTNDQIAGIDGGHQQRASQRAS